MSKKFLIGLLTWLCLFAFPPVNLQSAETNYFLNPEYSKTISMDFKDASLNDVLKVFSQQSELNFIADQSVIDKKITLFLDQVPVEEALERILQANNLTYEIQSGSNVFIVKPLLTPAKELITRVYHLKYATVASSKLNNTITIDTQGGAGGTTASGSSTGIAAAIKTILSSSGQAIEDPRTNSLIVTDMPALFPSIEQTIARMDVPVPQVLIEVEMLDVSKNTADLLGIKYGSTPLAFSGASRTHYYPWDENELVRAAKITTASTYTVGTLSAAGLTASLQFLKTQSDTRNLARPRILTLSNETAQIKIATNEAIGLSTGTQSAEGTATQTFEAERVATGVFLTVTPQVNLLSNDITLAVSPKVIEARTGATFEGKTFKDPEERGTQSILRISDGDTIVLGGLLRTEASDAKTKLPILGDIPILGAAFRHKDKSNEERELIIFITPHVISDSKKPQLAYNDSREIIREQDIPQTKNKEVEKALSAFETR